MLKSLAIGLLSLTATVSTAALAGTTSPAPAGNGLGILCYILPFLCAPQPGPGGHVTSAPEIDPASAAAALTLLGGGLAVLRARRYRKPDKKDS